MGHITHPQLREVGRGNSLSVLSSSYFLFIYLLQTIFYSQDKLNLLFWQIWFTFSVQKVRCIINRSLFLASINIYSSAKELREREKEPATTKCWCNKHNSWSREAGSTLLYSRSFGREILKLVSSHLSSRSRTNSWLWE